MIWIEIGRVPRNPGPQCHVVKQLPWIQSQFWMQIDDSRSNYFCVYHAECSSMLGTDSLPLTLSYVCSLYSHIVCSLNDHIGIWYATNSYLIPLFSNSHLYACLCLKRLRFPPPFDAIWKPLQWLYVAIPSLLPSIHEGTEMS